MIGMPEPRKRMSRTSKYILCFMGFAIIVAGLTIWLYFLAPDDQDRAQLRIAGLTSPVEVIIDRHEFRHIYARNQRDLFCGLGYVHAARFLYHLDVGLRAARGELAAVWGPDYVACDRLARLLNFKKMGNEAYALLDSSTIAILEAYTRGINQYIQHHPYDLPSQFKRKGYQPLRWQGQDCLIYLRCWQWLSTDSWQHKILLYKLLEIYDRPKIAAGLAERLLATLPPDLDYDFQTELFSPLTTFWRWNQQLQLLFPYSRILSPSSLAMKADAGAVLHTSWPARAEDTAGDLMVDLNAPHYQAAGLSLPGIPVVFTGYHEQLAWMLARNRVDDVHFATHTVLFDTLGWYAAHDLSPLTVRPETLAVKAAHDTILTFYESDYGPLIDLNINAVRDTQQVVVVQWAGTRYQGFLETMLALGRVSNWNEFAAVTSTLQVPGLQLYYADQTGQLGKVAVKWDAATAPYFAGPLITPQQKIFSQPTLWETENHYTFDPAQHYFLSAECSCTAPAMAFGDSLPWQNVAADKAFSSWQQQKFKCYARLLCQPLFELVNAPELETPLAREAYHLLEQWNFEFNENSSALTFYTHFMVALISVIYADEMQLADPALWDQFIAIPATALQSLLMVIQAGESSWFDQVRTPQKTEHIRSVYQEAFQNALVYLVDHYGSNIAEWEWRRVTRPRIPLLSNYKKIITSSSSSIESDNRQTLTSQAVGILQNGFQVNDPMISINLQDPHRLVLKECWPAAGSKVCALDSRRALFSSGMHLMPAAQQRLQLRP